MCRHSKDFGVCITPKLRILWMYLHLPKVSENMCFLLHNHSGYVIIRCHILRYHPVIYTYRLTNLQETRENLTWKLLNKRHECHSLPHVKWRICMLIHCSPFHLQLTYSMDDWCLWVTSTQQMLVCVILLLMKLQYIWGMYNWNMFKDAHGWK